jgi:hypothetical protein
LHPTGYGVGAGVRCLRSAFLWTSSGKKVLESLLIACDNLDAI